MEDAVLPGRYHRACLQLGSIEHDLDRSFDHRAAHLRKQLLHPSFAEMRSADHSGKIATEIMGITDIERDHVENVVAQPAPLIELDRGDAETFLPDLGGVRIVGAVGRAADVALMRAHDGPEQSALTVEDRYEGGHI